MTVVGTCRKVIGPEVFSLLMAALVGASASGADWTLWDGPRREFWVDKSEPLADTWPVAGPRVLWQRQPGEGYSAIAVRDYTLFTLYRRNAPFWQTFTADQEVVIALDATTANTKWEFAYVIHFKSLQAPGPHVMPQVVGDLVFTVGVTGKLHALKAQTGELVWLRDLYQELGGTRLEFGYASHPLPYGIRASGSVGKRRISCSLADS
jgi:hypothetical protein